MLSIFIWCRFLFAKSNLDWFSFSWVVAAKEMLQHPLVVLVVIAFVQVEEKVSKSFAVGKQMAGSLRTSIDEVEKSKTIIATAICH